MDDVVDKVIATTARRQGGFITRAQLLQLGRSAEQIKSRIWIGRLISVLSHRSAASLWGFYSDWKFPFEVTTREDRRPRGITFT